MLFGVENLPPAPTAARHSEVFAEAGFAALHNPENDFTIVTKFGMHGGAHGHFDKLSFILYANGRALGIDPGTQLYGLPLHREWDSMTVAHNTISVDQERICCDWQAPGLGERRRVDGRQHGCGPRLCHCRSAQNHSVDARIQSND